MENSVPRGALKPLFIKNKMEGRHAIALYLVSEYSIKTVDSHEREIYIFREGYYMPAQNFLSGEVEDILGSLSQTNVKNEIINKVRDMTLVSRDVFNPPLNLINLNNGVYDIEAKVLLPHSPKYNFLSKIPTNFNAEADCPTIKQFLGQILNEEDIKIIQEFLGFALYRRYFIKKAIILTGEKDTGKTTLLTVIESFIGKDNLSGISLQKISVDKFATATLYQKYINSFDDLSFKDISENGNFKMATGGGTIPGEFKFGSPFKFENFAKLIFSANKVPVAKDNDDLAYFSRWIVITFNKKIEHPDNFLKDKLTTPEEMSGALNLALVGLQNLLDVGKFSYTKEPFEIKQIMEKSGSSIANFVADCLEREVDNWISKDSMYDAFSKYVDTNGMRITNKQDFGKELQNYANYITDGKQTVLGKQVHSWRNVKFKEGELQNNLEDEAFEGYGEVI